MEVAIMEWAVRSPKAFARVGGWLYLIVIVGGIFAELFVRSKMIVLGDAAATARNIMASQSLWRAAFVADTLAVVCYVAVTTVLYVLLRPVNKNLSLLAAFVSLVGCAILGLDGLGHIAPLTLLGGAHYLQAFDVHQREALTLLVLQWHAAGYQISVVFFDFYALMLGYLILRSGFFPKFLGVLLIVGFAIDLVSTMGRFLAPAFADRLPGPLLSLGGIAELALCLWLIVVGVNAEAWHRRSRTATA